MDISGSGQHCKGEQDAGKGVQKYRGRMLWGAHFAILLNRSSMCCLLEHSIHSEYSPPYTWQPAYTPVWYKASVFTDPLS